MEAYKQSDCVVYFLHRTQHSLSFDAWTMRKRSDCSDSSNDGILLVICVIAILDEIQNLFGNGGALF